MSFLFLPNTAGNNISSMVYSGGNTYLSPGYDFNDVISGPRSAKVKVFGQSTHTFTFNLVSATSITHSILTHMNAFVNNSLSNYHRFYVDGAIFGGTKYPKDLDTILLGPNSEDWVFESSQSGSSSFASEITVTSSAAEVFRGKIYFSNSFDMGTEPEIYASSTLKPKGDSRRVKPLLGHEWYETEKVFTMNFPAVTRAKKEAFENLPLRWPLFIYDSAADIWSHKLEHVILTQYSYSHIGRGQYDISCEFQRLEHREL